MDEQNQIIVATEVIDQANNKQQAVSIAKRMLEDLERAGIAPPIDENGQEAKKIVHTLDSGYCSEQATQDLEDLGIDASMSTGR
ncbi:MAG: hypothetical protein ACFCD0_13610 [Gemmataceae bacterium]